MHAITRPHARICAIERSRTHTHTVREFITVYNLLTKTVCVWERERESDPKGEKEREREREREGIERKRTRVRSHIRMYQFDILIKEAMLIYI